MSTHVTVDGGEDLIEAPDATEDRGLGEAGHGAAQHGLGGSDDPGKSLSAESVGKDGGRSSSLTPGVGKVWESTHLIAHCQSVTPTCMWIGRSHGPGM